MARLTFTLAIYPSLASRGSFVVSLINDKEENLVLGMTSDVNSMKRTLEKVFSVSKNGWSYDPDLRYHSLVVDQAVSDSNVPNA